MLEMSKSLDYLCFSSSSSSCKVALAFSESARLNRPLRPPLRGAPEGSSIAARSLSSRDMRFSAAVNVPCDRGDGFRRLTWGVVDDDVEVDVVVGGVGARRAEALDEDEPVR